MKNEKVLAIPTNLLHECGIFQGFTSHHDRFLPTILNPANWQFLPRALAEEDPNYKQIVPYVVLKNGEQVFHYSRGKEGTENRLRSLRSIGIGGHINDCDSHTGEDIYRQGMLREIHEEVDIQSDYTERFLGVINDDRTPVGQVHIGIVHVFELAEPKAHARELSLAKSGFASLSELREDLESFETWSQFLLATNFR